MKNNGKPTTIKPCRGGCGKLVDEEDVVCQLGGPCYEKMMVLMSNSLLKLTITRHPAVKKAAEQFNKKNGKPGGKMFIFQRRCAA